MRQIKNPYIPFPAVIKRIKSETHDTKTFTLSFMDETLRHNYSFAPGQFNMVSLFGIGEAPISISSDPSDSSTFQHTVRSVGNVTDALAKKKEGDIVWVRGPYGNGWPVDLLKGKNVLVVSGGIGLAPLRPVITAIVKNRHLYGDVEVLYGARNPDERLFTDEFSDWAKKIQFRQTVDSAKGYEWPHTVGVVTVLFDIMTSKPDNAIVLTCGPEIMMKFVVKGLIARGFSPEQIYVSLERRMNCGVGKCGNCQIGSKFVCKDGPVFAYAELQTLVENVLGGVGD